MIIIISSIYSSQDDFTFLDVQKQIFTLFSSQLQNLSGEVGKLGTSGEKLDFLVCLMGLFSIFDPKPPHFSPLL